MFNNLCLYLLNLTVKQVLMDVMSEVNGSSLPRQHIIGLLKRSENNQRTFLNYSYRMDTYISHIYIH